MARFSNGFAVGCESMKFFSVNGVCIWLSFFNALGNGVKYHKSWNIIHFFAGVFLVARIGIRPKYLMTLLYRMRSGFIAFTLRWSLIASQKFNIAVAIPIYFINFAKIPFGALIPKSSTI